MVEFDPFGNFLRVVPLPPDSPSLAFFYPFLIDTGPDDSVWATRPNTHPTTSASTSTSAVSSHGRRVRR